MKRAIRSFCSSLFKRVIRSPGLLKERQEQKSDKSDKGDKGEGRKSNKSDRAKERIPNPRNKTRFPNFFITFDQQGPVRCHFIVLLKITEDSP